MKTGFFGSLCFRDQTGNLMLPRRKLWMSPDRCCMLKPCHHNNKWEQDPVVKPFEWEAVGSIPLLNNPEFLLGFCISIEEQDGWTGHLSGWKAEPGKLGPDEIDAWFLVTWGCCRMSWMPKERGGGKPAICLPLFLHIIITNRPKISFSGKVFFTFKEQNLFSSGVLTILDVLYTKSKKYRTWSVLY